MALSGSVRTNRCYDGAIGLEFVWSATQSMIDNKSTVSWTLRSYGSLSYNYWMAGPVKLWIAGTNKVNISDRFQMFGAGSWSRSGTVTIDHSEDGSGSFNVYIESAIYTYAVNCTASQTFTLDTIARRSDLTVENGTLGVAQVITADRKSELFSQTLTWKSGEYSGTICDKEFIRWWSFTPQLLLANGAPNGTEVYCEFTLTTWNGDTNIGSVTKGVKFAIPENIKPTVSMTVEDGKGYATRYGGFVQGKSTAKVKLTASGSYYSTIKSYSASANGESYNTAEFETGLLDTVGLNNISAYVTDSRGRKSNTIYNAVNVLAYENPQITKMTVHRCDVDGTENPSGLYAKVTYSHRATDVNRRNNCTVKVQYKKPSETEYTSVDLPSVLTSEDATCIFQADDASSYIIQLLVADNFTSTSRATSISTGYCLYHIPSSGKGITFGGVAEEDGFNVRNMDANFEDGLKKAGVDVITKDDIFNLIYPVGSIYMSANDVSPQTFLGGTWEAFGQGRTLVGVNADNESYNQPEMTGGEETHTLTQAETPNVSGNLQFRTWDNNNIVATLNGAEQDGCFNWQQKGGVKWGYSMGGSSSAYNKNDKITFDNGGQGLAHNNMQPYITVYMWKRTA